MKNARSAYLFVVTASIATLVIAPAMAVERQSKPRGTYITQAMIESSQGNHLSIPRFGKFVVKKVSAPGHPNAKCNINTASLKDLLQTGFRKGQWTLAKGVVVTVELKMRIANGEVFCLGGGTGCKAEVVVEQVYENAPL